jgi:3-methyladenine DNA glycosylase AlkD
MDAQTAVAVKQALAAVASPDDARFLQRFFKTGEGQYGRGDIFIGVRVPQTRAVVKGFVTLPVAEVELLLDSAIHEHRLAGLLILCSQFAKASSPSGRDNAVRHDIADCYLKAVRRGRVNNWDLVDSSAELLLGEYLVDRPRLPLFELARSESLWERRVGMLSTFAFLKHGDASTTLQIADLLLDDREDLINKAVGWMLREVGKRVDRELLLAFLDTNAARMSRTALSYATEHLDPELRADYRARR